MSYVLANQADRERERLAALESVADPFTIRRLEAIGVGPGWRCLEVGGGGGSIARWLCERVGPTGRVVATDIDTKFLALLDAPNLEVRRHDIALEALDATSFDLIHERSLLEHLPQRDAVLDKLVAALAPGGWLLAEDSDYGTFAQLRGGHEALYTRVAEGFLRLLAAGGHDRAFGRTLGCRLRDRGLADVRFECAAVEWGGDRPITEVWRLALEQLRPRLVGSWLVGEADLDAFLALIRDPEFVALSSSGCAAWGRAPREV